MSDPRPLDDHLRAMFDDVAVTASYAPAVAWLAETGITTGTGPTTFSPDDDVSRAQLAAFLCRYADTTTADAAAVQSVGSACGG